jgi:hypothetical protein
VSGIDDETRDMLESVYHDFNARNINAILLRTADNLDWPNGWEGGYTHGHDGVRDHWSRQWAQL